MSDTRRDMDDTGSVLGFGGLFDEKTDSASNAFSPRSTLSAGSGSSGIQAGDIERLTKSLDDGTKSRKSLRDDDATSVATSKQLDDGNEWELVEDGKPGGASCAAPAAIASDILSTWAPEKVLSLKQHVRAANWHDVRYRLQTFSKGMTGEEIVAWLKGANFAKSDEEACAIGQAMFDRQMFYQLNRRSKFTGFASTKKQQYTLEDNFTEENSSLSTKISRAVKSVSEVASVPYTLVPGNHVVTVLVEERQRRPDPSLPYSSEFLRPGIDGPAMSMDKSLVPVPPVDDESPDMCEWVLDEWEVVVDETTDDEGWKYSLDFKDPHKFVRSDATNKNFLVRLRAWARPARKQIEKKCERVEVVEAVKSESELAEERKKELLAIAAMSVARVPRTGTLELFVSHGKDLLVVRDSYLTVECGSGPTMFRERSDICPRSRCHQWQYKVDVPIASDLEAVRILVFQAASLGRAKCLGQSTLHIDANELSRDGPLALRSSPDDDKDDDARGSDNDDAGELFVTWTFSPTGMGVVKTSSAKRCILNVSLDKAVGLTREKKRMGPCGVPVPGKSQEKLQIFFRARYFGEYCEMECPSPLYKFAADVDTKWKFSGMATPSVPVTIEYWHSDQPTPVAFTTFEYSDCEQVLELDLKKCGMEGLPAQSSAGSNLGKLHLTVLWITEEDNLNALALGVQTSWSDGQKNLVNIWS